MLGTIILPLVVIFGGPDAATMSSDGPSACVPVGCTEYVETPASGYLLCLDTAFVYDSDEAEDDQLGNFPPGHWAFVSAELGDMARNLQSFGYAVVEY